jgi:hypothetical protein
VVANGWRLHAPRHFWQKRTFMDGDEYFYFPLAGKLYLEKPPHRTGGMCVAALHKELIGLLLLSHLHLFAPKFHMLEHVVH